MNSAHEPVDLRRVRTRSIAERPSKVAREDLGRPVAEGATVRELVDSLPRQLAAVDLREFLEAWRSARRRGRAMLALFGAHVVKCGLGPVVVDLVRRGYVTAIGLNGAGAIHDTELALWGKTSEDVAQGLATGMFGMAEETAAFLNEAARRAARERRGLGEMLGALIRERAPEAGSTSLLAACHERGVPLTVHVALGTDVVHQHPSADGAAIGESTFRDFRLLASVVSGLHDGGLVLHAGSAVLLPEVFLKALTVARNVGGPVDGFVAANLDFVRQYRPLENVVTRPTAGTGRGYNFVGHHEIMLPLMAAALRQMDSVTA